MDQSQSHLIVGDEATAFLGAGLTKTNQMSLKLPGTEAALFSPSFHRLLARISPPWIQ